MARFHTPLDDLCFRHPSAEPLMKRFRDLGDMFNQQPAGLDDPSRDGSHRLAEEAEVRHYNNLLDDWTGVIEEIRTFDGFL